MVNREISGGALPQSGDAGAAFVARMAPLFGRRSLVIMAIGLVIGIGLGVGYWVVSPSVSQMAANVQLTPGVAVGDGSFESYVSIQMVNPGSDFVNLKELQWRGEYYAAKANTYPFLEHLSASLAAEAPQYTFTAEELAEKVRIRYDYKGDLPALEVRVRGASIEEALFLGVYVPKAFQVFLIEEENAVAAEASAAILEELESTRQELLAAETALTSLSVEAAADDVRNDPEYVALNAMVQALQAEVRQQAGVLALLETEGKTGAERDTALSALDRSSIALAKAKSDLALLLAQDSAANVAETLDYSIAQTNVTNLNRSLADLEQRLTASLAGDSGASDALNSLAVGNPTEPLPVPVERVRGRNAIMIGGVIGLGAAWLALNRRWIAAGMPSTAPAEAPLDEEDEE